MFQNNQEKEYDEGLQKLFDTLRYRLFYADDIIHDTIKFTCQFHLKVANREYFDL